MLTEQQKMHIADELQNTASINTLNQLAEEFNVDDLDILIAAEEYGVIECEQCGWFTEPDDFNEEQICRECQ